MKLAKITNGTVTLTNVEGGRETTEPRRTEAALYAAGFKKACLTPRPSGDATEQWHEYPTCILQEWLEPETEEIEEVEG